MTGRVWYTLEREWGPWIKDSLLWEPHNSHAAKNQEVSWRGGRPVGQWLALKNKVCLEDEDLHITLNAEKREVGKVILIAQALTGERQGLEARLLTSSSSFSFYTNRIDVDTQSLKTQTPLPLQLHGVMCRFRSKRWGT